MNDSKKLFSRGAKDERLSAQLGEIYRVGSTIMALGILFDLYTRFNYLAQRDGGDGLLFQDPVESVVLIAAVVTVAVMKARRGIYSDSLKFTESRTFGEAGLVAPSLGLAALVGAGAVGGRLCNEVALFGWGGVTWAGDIAMFIVVFGMIAGLVLAFQYLSWWSYRRREDALMQEDED